MINTIAPEFLDFLKKVGDYAPPKKERKLFALGGRGHYENPISDMLRFFLNSKEEHKLNQQFLSAFLKCINAPSDLNMDSVTVEREVRTKDLSRIDLQISGSDWCLLIENKIHARTNNPFETYENHCNSLNKRLILSILSPDGNGVGKWVGVSYKNFCQQLRKSEFFSTPLLSKWHCFANEFILHLENELYTPAMNTEQAKIFEDYAECFRDAQWLLKEYPSYLCSEVKKKLDDARSTKGSLDYDIKVKVGWAIIIESPNRWGAGYIALRYPTTEESKGFNVSIYLNDRPLKNVNDAGCDKSLFEGLAFSEEHGCWWTDKKGETIVCRDEVIDFAVSKIKLVDFFRPSITEIQKQSLKE